MQEKAIIIRAFHQYTDTGQLGEHSLTVCTSESRKQKTDHDDALLVKQALFGPFWQPITTFPPIKNISFTAIWNVYLFVGT